MSNVRRQVRKTVHMSFLQVLFLALAVATVVIHFVAKKYVARRGMYVQPTSPLWVEATQKARATIPLLAQLHAESVGPIAVKYPLTNDRGQVEHVWGELLSIDTSVFAAALETPLLYGKPENTTHSGVPLASLEDWQVQLPDGRIRGGFTTQAEITMSKKAGRLLPEHVSAMEGHFVDA